MQSIKRGFTLLEIMIGLGIIGILCVVLFQAYTTVAQVTFRIQQQQVMHRELTHILDTFGSLAEVSTIDYTHYSGAVLQRNKGLVTDLYLTGKQGLFHFFSSGDALWMQHDTDEVVLLTDNLAVRLFPLQFKIIPWGDPQVFAQQDDLVGYAYMNALYHPGFWVLGRMVSLHTGIVLSPLAIQQYFSIQK